MLKVNTVQTNFTSGELSPWLLGRSDIERFQNGAEILENFLVRSQGGISRRLGTKNVGRTYEQGASSKVRVLPFEFSRTDAVLLEISAGRFRFFRDGVKIGAPYEVTVIYGTSTAIPYINAEINELQFSQSADVIFITHPNHPQATLSRYSDSDWRYEQPVFDYGPYLDQGPDDQNISLTVSTVTDRVILTSQTDDDLDSTHLAIGGFVEYSYNGQKVLGKVKALITDEQVDVEPLEDRSLILSKEVYSPGLYTTWDSTNNVPTYNTTITGTAVSVAFSAVGVVTQEHVGNYLRFCDKAGVYYWMLVTGVADILRQGAYGIIAVGNILTVYRPTGIITRGDRRINARLRSSYSTFFNLSTDANRLFRLVLGDTVVHARGRSQVTYTIGGNTTNGSNELDLSLDGANMVLPGDTVTGAGIPASTIILSTNTSGAQAFAVLSNNATATATSVVLTIGVSTTQELGVTLNRSLPRSIEGLVAVQNGSTNDWNRGAWYTGNYPQTVTFVEGRLGFGGTTEQPQTGWLSRTDDLYNFAATDEKLRVLDDSAITFTIASETLNEVLWMCAREVLVVGTVGAEWKVSAGATPGSVLTPTNISAKIQSSYGSAFTKPISVGKSVLFLQRAGRKLRQMSYDFQTDSQVSLDLTVFAEHVLKDHSGASQLAYQQLPESVVFALLDDGQIGVLAYEPDQQIYAWSRFIVGGPSAIVESIACVPEDNQYRLYAVVSRLINAVNVRTIEVLNPEFRPTTPTGKSTMIFMDNYMTAGVPGSTSITTGLADYKGCTVNVQVDDLVYHAQTVSTTGTGTITLPTMPTTRYAIGFAYTSKLKTFPLEAPAQGGTGQGKQKRIDHITLRLLDSINFQHGSSLSSLHEEEFRVATDPVLASPPMFSGDKRVAFEDGSDTRASFFIVQSKSYPLSILSVMPEAAQFK